MSKSFLVDYVNEKLKEYSKEHTIKQKGVITISREYGCPGKIVSSKIAEALSSSENSWKVIDKEALQIAAQELSIPEDLAEKLFHSKPRTLMQDLFSSFTDSNVPSDTKVKKTIAKVLRTIILYGNVVVLGQGGVVLARDVKPSLHVFLHANPHWRVEKVKILENLKSNDEALKRIKEVDEQRIFLRNYYAGEPLNANIFDVAINCEYFSEEEIISIILDLAKKKGIHKT